LILLQSIAVGAIGISTRRIFIYHLLADKSWLKVLAPFGWNYKSAEKHCWLIFCERKILFRLKKKQAE
jgi:hypothetical protein